MPVVFEDSTSTKMSLEEFTAQVKKSENPIKFVTRIVDSSFANILIKELNRRRKKEIVRTRNREGYVCKISPYIWDPEVKAVLGGEFISGYFLGDSIHAEAADRAMEVCENSF